MDTAIETLKGFRILVAEDDRHIQLLMKRCLECCGAKVTTASNGLDAIDTLLHGSFDIALMDIEMPVLGGLEAADRLRREGYHEPLIALSSLCSVPELKARIEQNFDDKFDKPVEFPRLIASIRQLKERGEPRVPDSLH